MPTPRKTQKQIAQRYAGNLLYNSFFSPLRSGRTILVAIFLIVGVIIAGIYLRDSRTNPKTEWLNSPGGISQAHAGLVIHSKSGLETDCKQCHVPLEGTFPLQLAMSGKSIDARCMKCHAQHTFHQADLAVDHSCVSCHHEHLGTGSMQPVADINCRGCHANAETMTAYAVKETGVRASHFEILAKEDFQPPRPAQGYTSVIHSFDGDHPNFEIQRAPPADFSKLKFSHEIHLTGAIPMVNGRKLDCAFCHQPDSRGAYMQPINFAKNCQVCHGLQIDPTLPDFQIPHPQPGGRADSVRDFLLTLPTQYTLYASQNMTKLQITEPSQIAAFVQKHMERIRQRTRRGADLVKDTFQPTLSPERPQFPSCAYCHEVSVSGDEMVVSPPVLPTRWYVHARFDHSVHKNAPPPVSTPQFELAAQRPTGNCESCHLPIWRSADASSVALALPDKASCVECHGATGGVVSTCVMCHDYHNPDPSKLTTEIFRLRKMIAGGP